MARTASSRESRWTFAGSSPAACATRSRATSGAHDGGWRKPVSMRQGERPMRRRKSATKAASAPLVSRVARTTICVLEPTTVGPVPLLVRDAYFHLLHLSDEVGQVRGHLLEDAPALLHAGVAQRIADGRGVAILVVVHRHEDVLRVPEDDRAHAVPLAERGPHPPRGMGAVR